MRFRRHDGPRRSWIAVRAGGAVDFVRVRVRDLSEVKVEWATEANESRF